MHSKRMSSLAQKPHVTTSISQTCFIAKRDLEPPPPSVQHLEQSCEIRAQDMQNLEESEPNKGRQERGNVTRACAAKMTGYREECTLQPRLSGPQWVLRPIPRVFGPVTITA
jgi:hypothetical protein